jgi:hypothetical protein
VADAVTVLRSAELVMPEPVVQAAGIVGLDLASAAAIAFKESRAQMIWGHDGVDPAGTYVKGGPVTAANYWAYRKSPTAGWQGVGIFQLTWKGYIAEAEKLNPTAGAADPVTNCRVGCQALKDLQRQYGEQDGARAYNGTNAAAQAYGADFIKVRDRFRGLLAGAATTIPTPTPPAGALPDLHEGDESELIWRLQKWLNAMFSYSHIDAGPGPKSRLGKQSIAAMENFQVRVGISTKPPFGWGARSWAQARSLGFPG